MIISVFKKVTMPETKEDKKLLSRYASKPYLPEKIECKDIKSLLTNVTRSGWSPFVFRDYRRQDGFLSTDFLVLDIDAGLSISDSLKIVERHNITCICLPTSSHRKENTDRFRLIFPLVSRITNKKSYKETINKLYELFPDSDPQCITDTARYYFPCKLSDEGYVFDGDFFKPVIVEKEHNVIKETKKVQVTENAEEYVRKIYGSGKKEIPESIDFFIKNAHTGLEGEWNSSLNSFVFVLTLQGVEFDVIYSIVEILAPYELDSRDIYTIERSHNQALEVRDE